MDSTENLNPADKLTFINKVFLKLNQKQSRFETASKRRAGIFRALQSGNEPSGALAPRYHWVKEGASKVLALLGAHSKTFNVMNPDDIATIQDLIDILETASKQLQSKLK